MRGVWSTCQATVMQRSPGRCRNNGKLVLRWCNEAGLPAHVLLTKADKLKRGAAGSTFLQVRRRLLEMHPDSSLQLFSSLTREGADAARATLDDWLGITAESPPGPATD